MFIDSHVFQAVRNACCISPRCNTEADNDDNDNDNDATTYSVTQRRAGRPAADSVSALYVHELI